MSRGAGGASSVPYLYTPDLAVAPLVPPVTVVPNAGVVVGVGRIVFRRMLLLCTSATTPLHPPPLTVSPTWNVPLTLKISRYASHLDDLPTKKYILVRSVSASLAPSPRDSRNCFALKILNFSEIIAAIALVSV